MIIISFLLRPIEISACLIDHPRNTYVLGIFGFIFGAATFPLDWSVCRKEPPISHVVLLIIGTFIGSLLDYLDYVQIIKKLKKN